MGNALQTREEFLIDYVQRGSTVYGYSIHDRKGYFSSALAHRFGTGDAVENLPEWMVRRGNVAPESIGDWRRLFHDLDSGAQSSFAMVSLRSDDGSFGRYWLRADVSVDEQGQSFFAVITSDNFTELFRRVREQSEDNQVLLHAAQVYPEIISINLTRGTYRVVRYDAGVFEDLPPTGTLADLVKRRGSHVLEADRRSYRETFCVDRMAAAFARGKEASIQLAYRRPGPDGSMNWMETTVSLRDQAESEEVLLVSMSRSIDQQKAEEIRLREEIRLKAEELRVTAGKMSQTICYYEVPTRTLIVPPEYAAAHNMPEVIPDYPNNIHMAAQEYYPEVPGILRAFCDGMIRGEPVGACEVPFIIPDVGTLWKKMEYAMVYDQDGAPKRAVIYLSDVTDQHNQKVENRQLKEQMLESQKIFQIVAQHSNRILYVYDLDSCMTRPWDEENAKKDILTHLYKEAYSEEKVNQNEAVLPEMRAGVKKFFADIHGGVPFGDMNIRVRLEDGQLRWYHFKYSSIFYGGQPGSALISVEDITERHEHRMAYLHYVQTVEHESEQYLLYVESDLTTDRIEKFAGRILAEGDQELSCSHTDFGRLLLDRKFRFLEAEKASAYFSREALLLLYEQGRYRERTEWQVRYPDDSVHWLDTDVVLMEEPYSGHVQAFCRMRDMTEEKLAQLEILERSERDRMTGLYNRVTAEERTRQLMSDHAPGILVLLDLDDLKGINDTYGHDEGDRAILGIAQVLKKQFRESDVLGRLGGDEFLIYLPGAAESTEVVSFTITTMLRKLSSVSVGEDQHIRCSIGCAVQRAQEDPFEVLFKQADKALYHVKRSGKNDFAFYEPEMEQADYQFRTQKLLSQKSKKKFDTFELQHLLGSIASFYQRVYSVNLSTNDYYLMESSAESYAGKHSIQTFGTLDQLVETQLGMVHPDDREKYAQTLSRQGLLAAYAKNETSVQHYFRYQYQEEYRWAEVTVMFYTNEQGDICDSTLMRWADERAHELERLWMQKVMELVVMSSFEYICLVNLTNGEYSLYGDEANTHGVPTKGDFDVVTKVIRDRSIEESERETYYENAKISTIMARMNENNGNYSYTYTMPDGVRKASFHWFEATRTQVLMTVQRISNS